MIGEEGPRNTRAFFLARPRCYSRFGEVSHVAAEEGKRDSPHNCATAG